MNRLQRRRVAIKRRLVTMYSIAAVLTLGVIPVMVLVAIQQPLYRLAWFGCWGFVVHQIVMLVVHVRGARRAHVEHTELIEEYTRKQEAGQDG